MLAFLRCGVCLEDSKELLGRVYALGVAYHLNIRHNKISENKLSENFAQNCRHFQMPELPGNTTERNFCQKLHLEDLASDLGVSPNYLSAVYRR